MLLAPFICLAQPKSELAAPTTLDPAEGQREARALIARLLEQRPEQPLTNTGVLRIRDREGKQREVPASFEVIPTATNWLNIYEAVLAPHSKPTVLTIIHHGMDQNVYELSTADGTKKLGPDEIMTPFAGSDFWVADLGLDFLHWPDQRVLRKQMRKGLSCDVLQSVISKPVSGGYSRVLSWIAINRPDDIVIVHAEAFDGRDRLLKEFDPRKVEKVNGLWQLEEMEIRNRQTSSRTRIDFDLNRP